MSSLEKQCIVVTGAASGLGAAICRVLARAGADVVATDVNLQGAEKIAAEIAAAGGHAIAQKIDVSDEKGAAAALDSVVQRCGRLDVLVNNAGIDFTLSIDELTLEQWDAVLRVNLRGPFLLSKLAARIMKSQGRGQIVNITSTAALRTWPNASAYHASKWGLRGLSHALHAELRPHGIKVSAVIAGGMRTPFLLGRFPDLDPNLLQDPQNVAGTIRFLLTLPDESVIPEVMVLPMREGSWP